MSFTDPSMVVSKGTFCSDQKTILTDKVVLSNEETELPGWKFFESIVPAFIGDDFAFDADKDIYARIGFRRSLFLFL